MCYALPQSASKRTHGHVWPKMANAPCSLHLLYSRNTSESIWVPMFKCWYLPMQRVASWTAYQNVLTKIILSLLKSAYTVCYVITSLKLMLKQSKQLMGTSERLPWRLNLCVHTHFAECPVLVRKVDSDFTKTPLRGTSSAPVSVTHKRMRW